MWSIKNIIYLQHNYRKTSTISRTLVGNKIVEFGSDIELTKDTTYLGGVSKTLMSS